MDLTRRQFFKGSPLFALSTSFLGTGQGEEKHSPHISFPTKSHDRLAVTSWPFRAYIESPNNKWRDPKQRGIDLTEFAALIKEKFGVENINPLADHFRSTEPSYFDRFRDAVDHAGSHVVDLGLGGRQFYSADAPTRRAGVNYGRKWIDIARVIGSPSVRQHVARSPGTKPDIGLAAQSLGELADYGWKRDIIVNLENDDPIAEDPFFLAGVVDKVNSPYLRTLPDFGNSLIGHNAEYNERAVRAMLKFAYSMCHVKDIVQSEDGTRQAIDLKRMFGIARENSYRGYFSMEFDTDTGDPFRGTEALIQESLRYM